VAGLLALSALVVVLPVTAGSLPQAGAATAQAASAGHRERPTKPRPGLSAAEHAALVRAGAFGARPLRFLIVGDSIAMTLGMGLSVRSEAGYGVTVLDHAALGCDLDTDLEIHYQGIARPGIPGCQDWRDSWPVLAAQTRPQVVALGVGRWEVADHLFDGLWVHVGDPVWDDHLAADLESAVALFSGFGAKVVLLTMPYVDPTTQQTDGLPWPEDTPARTQAYNSVVWEVARSDPRRVSVVDLNRMLAPGGVYTASLDGMEVRTTDGIHISVAGGELLQREILPPVVRLGLQDEAATKGAGKATAGPRTAR
jgi:hypothetical protein